MVIAGYVYIHVPVQASAISTPASDKEIFFVVSLIVISILILCTICRLLTK